MTFKHEPMVFVNNAGALGDCVATLPVIKYAIEEIWKEGNYRILVNDYFKPLFFFVPEEKFAPFKQSTLTYELFGERFGYKLLHDTLLTDNGRATGMIAPEKMSLMDYASIKLLGRILEPKYKIYPKIPLDHIDISKFGLPEKYACIVATTMHEVRVIESQEIIKIAEYLIARGITPIYLGKTEREVVIAQFGKSYGSTFVDKGINLVDKTSIMEAAAIMNKAIYVIGPDSGLMHLAGCTNTNVICAYTTIDPKVMECNWQHQVVPDKDKCRFCQSEAYWHNNDFNRCKTGTLECVKSLTSNKFIAAIEEIQ